MDMGFDPISLMVVGSSVLGATSSVLGGISEKKQYNYQSRVALENAARKRQDATLAMQAGQNEESAFRADGTGLLASQRAAFGANNVDVDVGTPLEVADATRRDIETDALMLRYNAAREAYNYRLEADSLTEEARQLKKAGKSAMVQGVLGAGKSLIGGATALRGNAAAMKAAGGGGSTATSSATSAPRLSSNYSSRMGP